MSEMKSFIAFTLSLLLAAPAASLARGGGGGAGRGGGGRAGARPNPGPRQLPKPGDVGRSGRGGGAENRAGEGRRGRDTDGSGSRHRDSKDENESAGLHRRRAELDALRHRRRDGEGGHHRRLRRELRYMRWYNWSGLYGGGLWWGNPYYDPFYRTGSYRDEDQEDRQQKGERNIEVRVQPREAEISVNGVSYGRGRASFSLPSGAWTMELTAPGYLPQILELIVEPGVKYRVERSLKRDESSGRRGRPLDEEKVPELLTPQI